MPPVRQSAWDVSFPDDSQAQQQHNTQGVPSRHAPQHAANAPKYHPTRYDEMEEDPRIPFLLGEDPMDHASLRENELPCRLLSNFTIFDSDAKNVLVSLANLSALSHFGAAGVAAAYLEDEEDAGQEDRDDSDVVPLQLRNITCTFDYTEVDGPVQIYTDRAAYILKNPSSSYKPMYDPYYRRHKTLQKIISTARGDPRMDYKTFAEVLSTSYDEVLGRCWTTNDIALVKGSLPKATEGLSEAIRTSAIVQYILSGRPLHLTLEQHNANTRKIRMDAADLRTVGNIDVSLLRQENQNPTHVTSHIANLASGLFREQMFVVGKRTEKVRKEVLKKRESAQFNSMKKYQRQTLLKVKAVKWRPEWAVDRNIGWFSKAEVNGTIYSVGDIIVIPKKNVDMAAINEKSSLSGFFKFGQIIYIRIDTHLEQAHVRWFEHSAGTVLENISNIREFFITNSCDHVDLQTICGQVEMKYVASGKDPNDKNVVGEDSCFYRYLFDEKDGSFKDAPILQQYNVKDPRDSCPVCILPKIHETNRYASEPEYEMLDNGVKFDDGRELHIYDCAFFSLREKHCQAGMIIDFRVPARGEPTATLQLIGFVNDIPSLPDDVMKDERHVFLSDERVSVALRYLGDRLHIAHIRAIPDLSIWHSLSPFHFHLTYQLPTAKATRWAPEPVDYRKARICVQCMKVQIKKFQRKKEGRGEGPTLRALDVFAGVGAFGLGMEEAGGIRVTHAIEISPSAAKTLKLNAPDVTVYNQDANLVLNKAAMQYYKPELASTDPPLKSLADDKTPLPPPPHPRDIDVILAGFPCQPHSRLNMFQKANDSKSNLILVLLSYVDLFKPKYCFFENVRGFLQFSLNATQKDQYSVEGGIDMGGIKFLQYAMLTMDYQVRIMLLQGGHYGLPQTRIRFFMVAAKRGYHLPEVPQPTHQFPANDGLEIKFTNGIVIRPVQTNGRSAPFRSTTIEDAIGDLPRFDWKNPQKLEKQPLPGTRQREDEVLTLDCDPDKGLVGLTGRVGYFSSPRTSFQFKCRERPTSNLQHINRVLNEGTVERVRNIPLEKRADYRSLRENPKLWEWQFSDRASSIAKKGFRGGLYGRLDKDGFFQTTVTNVEPTAKQSRVLHPWCHRILTVRELARSQGFPDWFVFVSETGDIKTMHRQIGNAVPLPVGAALGRSLRAAVLKKKAEDDENAIVLD